MKRARFLAAAGGALIYPRFARASSLHSQVAAIARDVPGTIGVLCRTLAAGPPAIAFNAHMSFPTASTIKMLIMATAFAHEERHRGTLDTEIVTRRRNLIGGSEFMDQAADGERFTVRQLIAPMIELSDNTASNVLIAHFGVRAINALGAKAGLTGTHLARQFLDSSAVVLHEANITTPADMARLLYLIERGSREDIRTIASAEHCRRMIDIMLGQTDREGIPAGLPGIQVANKTGAIDGTRNDIAIVEPFENSPYILSIYSKQLDDTAAMYEAMRRLARISFHSLGATDA